MISATAISSHIDKQTGILSPKLFRVQCRLLQIVDNYSLSDCHNMSKLIFDHTVLLFFSLPMYIFNFSNIHPFSNQTIPLKIRVTHTNFIKLMQNNYIKADFKKFPTIDCNVLIYYCVYLCMRY